MKLLVPVAGIFIGAASCCCCGLDPEELMEQLDQGSASTDGEAWEQEMEEALADPADAGTDEAVAAVAGGSSEGLCGRFKSDGLTLPSGYSVIACTANPGSESLLAMGGTPPTELCAAVKSWATGASWSVESEVEMSGTVAMTLKSGDSRMSLSCTDTTGQTSLAVSITPG
jgi:hypothetical protein